MKIILFYFSLFATTQVVLHAQDRRLYRTFECENDARITHYRYRADGHLERTVNWDSTFVYLYDESGRPREAYSIEAGKRKSEERFVWAGADKFTKYLRDDSLPMGHGIIFNRRKNGLYGDSVWQFRPDSVKVATWRYHWNRFGLLDSSIIEWSMSPSELLERHTYQYISEDLVKRDSWFGPGHGTTCYVDIYERDPISVRTWARPPFIRLRLQGYDALGRWSIPLDRYQLPW